VTIALKGLANGMAQLTVQDNGIGMDLNGERPSMGMRLIKGVVAQMGGTYNFWTTEGLIFEAQLSLSTEQRRASSI
jgi:two-component sensor histidine kinase